MDTSLKIQMDVKNNAEELQKYMLDMNNWEEEMKKKEIALSNEKPQKNPIPPPRNKIKRNKSDNEKNHPNKPKKISAYDYSAWDKFDVEKACAEVDEDSDTGKDQEQVYQETSRDHEDEAKDDLISENKNLTLIDEAFYEKEMGNQFVKKGQWGDAIKCYTNAINLHSSNAIYYANRSLCFLKLKNFKSAETDATTAIQLDKNYVKAYQRRALARLALRQLSEAKSDYQVILAIEPKNTLAKAEIDRIDEMLKKEQGFTDSNKKATFEYKNIFKSEETKPKNTAVPNKIKRKTLENINSSESQKLSPNEASKPECKSVVKSKINSTGNFNNDKNLNCENKSQCLEKGDGIKIGTVQSMPEVFKSLPEGCTIVHPIQLPPHKRSKKPLRRIDITVKDEVIGSSGDAKTTLTIPYDRIEEQSALHKLKSEDEFQSRTLSLEVPKTAIQLQNSWKLIKKNPKECYLYLKKIPGKDLEHIFENSLESSFFSELVTFLANDNVDKEAEFIYDFLLGLSKVKRFRSLILFMSQAERTWNFIWKLILKSPVVLLQSLINGKMINHIRDQLAKSVSLKTAEMLSMNREWANALKRFPAVAAVNFKERRKRLSLKSSAHASDIKEGSKTLSESIMEVPQVISDLRTKLSQKNAVVPEEKHSWKRKKNAVSDLSIIARTNYILNSVVTAESDHCKIKRLEDLIEHFLQYPEGIGAAIKNGAISKLLRFRSRNHNSEIGAALREVLAMMGYFDPLPNQGIRILSIDGGGVRGLLVMEMLIKLEELTGKKINELFDYICGVSTGSIIACTIGASGKSIKEISDLYKELSNKIFNQNVLFGARSLIWNHGYYDTALWEELLKEHVGTTTLIKTSRQLPYPKIGVISTVTKKDQVIPFVFRNYGLPHRVKSKYLGSYRHELWESARASAAAPTYFEEFRLGEYLHQDGGILVNNPTAVAVHEAKHLWPNNIIQCVVSCGTGRVDPGHFAGINSEKPVLKQTSWKEKFYNIIVSATDTEAVHMILNDLLPPSVYFRFNPFVTEMLSMDENQPEKLALLQQDALMYIRRNEEKFQEAAQALLKEKTVYQKLTDWLSVKSVEYCNKH